MQIFLIYSPKRCNKKQKMNPSSIKKKVEENKLEEAIEEMEAYFKGYNIEYFQFTILLKRELRKAESEYRNGLVSNEGFSVSLNLISSKILETVHNTEQGLIPYLPKLEKESESPPFKSSKPRERKSRYWREFLSRPIVIAAICFLFIICLRVYLGEKKKALPVPGDTTFNILFLPFNPDRHCEFEKSKFEMVLYDRFEKLKYKYDLNIHLSRLEDVECPISISDAEHLGNEFNSNLVLWGSYDDLTKDQPQLSLKYLLIKGNEIFRPFLEDTEYKEISSLELLKEGYLQRDLDYVVLTSLAYAALKDANFDMFESCMSQIRGEKNELLSGVGKFVNMTKMLHVTGQEGNLFDRMSFENKLGLIYQLLGDYQQAIHYYQLDKEIKGEGNSLALASVYAKAGMHELAVEELTSGDKKIFHPLLFKCLYKSGQFQLGLESANEALIAHNKSGIMESYYERLFAKYKFLSALGEEHNAIETLNNLKSFPEVDLNNLERNFNSYQQIISW